MRWLLDPYLDGRTYTTIAYLLIELPLAVVAFTVVVAGLSAGLGLLVTVVGIPVLVATFLAISSLAGLQRRLAWSLLGAPMPRSIAGHDASGGLLWHRLAKLAGSHRTWREVWFAVVALPLAVAGFAFVTGVLWLMVAGFVHLALYLLGLESQFSFWVVDTLPEALVLIPVSLLFWLVGPRLILGWGTVTGRALTALLGRVEPEELRTSVVDTLTRTGSADGFAILDDLWLRFGRGPFVTPAEVEATLLEMKGRGIIRADRKGRRTSYRLA